MNILFIDYVAYKKYTYDSPKYEALGGTEASVVRVAHGLVQRQHHVFLYNHCDSQKSDIEYIGGIGHVGDQSSFPAPDAVIYIRCYTNQSLWRSKYPNAKHLIWYHDFGGKWLSAADSGMEGICVSHWHKMNLQEHIATIPDFIKKPIHIIYNPVIPYATRKPKIPGRLCFFSSPHKGLNRSYELYLLAKKQRPELSFVYSNPGYYADGNLQGDATNLGQLAHQRVCEEFSASEVTLYPVNFYPETFGISLAESNAMGTPVLACDLGAMREVLGMGNIILPVNASNEEILNALFEILDHKPLVTADARFSINTVIDQWEHLLRSPIAP